MSSRSVSLFRGRKKLSVSNVIVFVICVLIAFALWVHVMLTESPDNEKIFHHLQVELTNTNVLAERGLSIYGGYGNLVDVTLAGGRSVLSKLEDSDLVVIADTSICTASGRYDCKIRVDVPPGCRLAGISQETVNVYVDEAVTRSFDLTEQRENAALPEGCSAGSIEFPVDKVTVTGPLTTVRRVYRAKVVIDMKDMTKTKDFIDVPVVLVDSNDTRIDSKYLDYTPKSVSFTVPVVKRVSVPLNVVFKQGFLDAQSCEVTVVPSSVIMTGEPDVIDRSAVLKDIVLDEKTEFDPEKLTASKTVNLIAPEGVTLSAMRAEVNAVVDPSIKTREITIPGTSIIGTGAKEGVNYRWDMGRSLKIILMGPVSALTQIDVSDVTLVFDMSPYSENSGSVIASAEVVIDSPVRDQVIALGNYEVAATILDN